MNGWVDAPPRRRGLGCFGRGCLILAVFAIVLGIACFAGMYWGMHRNSAIFHGLYWLAKAQAIGQTPAPIPGFTASDAQIQSVHERCEDFEQKARAGQAAELELTADDINTLIATNQDMRGKIFVSIEGESLRCQASVPLGELMSRSGYYFNGDIAVELKSAESLENLQLSRITCKQRDSSARSIELEISFEAIARLSSRVPQWLRRRHDGDQGCQIDFKIAHGVDLD